MPAYPARQSSHSGRGFTLIELLVVLAIVALLCTLASPRYFQSLGQSKEAVLIQNLQTTRETIDKFYADTGRYPESLDELVEKKYLRSLPVDPITEGTTWLLIAPESPDENGVYDIQSGAQGNRRDGTPFSAL
jgi:general secretion pathway protein G